MTTTSYWHDSLPADDAGPRSPLGGDTDVDVVVVGAGFTGLWTAHSLLRRDPGLRVVVLERDVAGWGASGRNGGWCVGDYGGPERAVAKVGGAAAVETMARLMHESVDEVGRVVADAGIDCGFRKGGALYLATDRGQHRRLRHHHAQLERHGLGDAWTLLDVDEAAGIVHADRLRGALHTPHAAAVHPARLARGLAVEVERLGGTVHEHTPVERIDGRRVRTPHGTVRAEVVVRSTEGYTTSIAGHERQVLPLGNHVVATEPVDESTWARIGLADRQLFELGATLLGYGQRTEDGRIVWGGLGAFAPWKGRAPAPDRRSRRLEDRLRRGLVDLFPVLDGIRITHGWSGILGVTRDLLPGVTYDAVSGLATAGGYTGQGVAAANAAGRTLADLVTGTDSDLVRLPWVGHRSRRWEPEPLPWLAVHSVIGAARVADAVDRRRG